MKKYFSRFSLKGMQSLLQLWPGYILAAKFGARVTGSWTVTPRSKKALRSGLFCLHSATKRTVCKAVKMKLKFQWSPQDIGDARDVGHSLGKPAGTQRSQFLREAKTTLGSGTGKAGSSLLETRWCIMSLWCQVLQGLVFALLGSRPCFGPILLHCASSPFHCVLPS